jgi:hypothetical protein
VRNAQQILHAFLMTSATVVDAAHRCLASFDTISQISDGHVSGSLPSEDGRSRYHIWASNLGSLHPGTDRRSADYRLREAPEVVERIVELLEELTEINSDILEILSGARTNRQISESDDDSESSDELSELNLSVGDIITSLFKVSMLVKKATTRDRYAKAASAKEAAFLAEFDIRHVADKYPKLRTQPWLLQRLGNAITQRRQFLRYCRNHKHRIAHVSISFFILQEPYRCNPRLDFRYLINMHTWPGLSTCQYYYRVAVELFGPVKQLARENVDSKFTSPTQASILRVHVYRYYRVQVPD